VRRFIVAAMLVRIALASPFAFGQSATVKLCVANMEISGAEVNSTAGREQLIKFMSKEKPDKALSIENVPVVPSSPSGALAAATGQKCDYVVTTNQAESHVESSNSGSASLPAFYVTLAYKLTKVSDSSEITSGTAKASDYGSEQNAIGFAMRKIAGKVTEAIKKAGPVTK
jgi:hypothetical protein